MEDIHGFGLRGRLLNTCLKENSFKVRVGSTFSDPLPQVMGVPQGSILSVTLFSVKINSITLETPSYLFYQNQTTEDCTGSDLSENKSFVQMHLYIKERDVAQR